MDDYFVREVVLPDGVKGATIPDENGDYNIYLNKRLSREGRIKAYIHEIEHIKKGHFVNDQKTVEEKESEVNGKGEKAEKWELEYPGL